MTSRLLIGAAVAAAAALALAGCAPHSAPAHPVAHHSEGASASSTPGPGSTRPATASPAPTALAAGVLMRVTAVATAQNGAAARLVLTVMAPTAGDGSEPAAMSAAQCDDAPWTTDIPAPRQWIRMTMTSTVLSGPSWPADDAIGLWGSNGDGWAAWSGAWQPFESYCDTGLAEVPGTATGVTPVGPTASTSDRRSWLHSPWGFDWAVDGDPPAAQPFAFTQCGIELGAAAQPYAAALTRTPTSGGYPASSSCTFGPPFS